MIVALLNQDGIEAKHKGHDEWCSPCPGCGGRDRFIVHPEAGRYWCRQCNIKGDAIEYLRRFRGMTYQQAAEAVGKDISSLPDKRTTNRTTTKPQEQTRAPRADQPELWNARKEELIEWANKALLASTAKLMWLRENRGLTADTVERFRLGWVEHNLFVDRQVFGLAPMMNDKGQPKKLFIPAGLVIPGPDRVRIRKAIEDKFGKYYVLPGSEGDSPLIINLDRDATLTPAIIVESELDAMLLAQEIEPTFAFVATGSTSNGPSAELLDNLRIRPFVAIALDGDQAGGKATWSKWMNQLRNAIRTPVPVSWGKDHTEAFLAGHDLGVWLSACYEIVMNAWKEEL
jgi:hypothetical protein